MIAIIFGITGQDGYYLNEICNKKNIKVIGISRSNNNWLLGDVANREQTEYLIKNYKPQYIFHLAAKSTTQHDALFENHETISTGTLNILEAVKTYSPDSKVFIVGSGVQFKNNGSPISEKDEFEATSPYSVSRIQSVYAARYFRSLGIRVYVGYLFHHESPFRKPNHISKEIALSVRNIAEGRNEIIEIGDILVEKEWTFAGDIARGIFTLVEQNDIYEATIGSGIVYSIKDWLEQCFFLIKLDWRDYVRFRHGFTPEYQRLVSCPKTMNALGWFPKVEISELAIMMVMHGI